MRGFPDEHKDNIFVSGFQKQGYGAWNVSSVKRVIVLELG